MECSGVCICHLIAALRRGQVEDPVIISVFDDAALHQEPVLV